MTQIIDFQKHLLKNSIKKEIPSNEIEFEIALTVAKYIYSYMQERFDDPLDVVTYHASTEELFNGDRNRFTASLLEIFAYWEIDLGEEQLELFDNEFELFPSVESVCLFVEKHVA